MKRKRKFDTKQLVKAFALLRKMGFLALRNVSDCNSCSWAKISQDYSDHLNCPVMFSHQQAEDSMKEDGILFLNFGMLIGEGEPGHSPWVNDAVLVAIIKEAVKVFESCGLKVSWDETTAHKVEVSLPEVD